MAQTIKLKRSSVSGNTPGTSDLELGEVAINTYDGKMFIKKNDGSDSIVEIGGTSGTVTEAFKTIAVSGQSNVVADSATDTLTLVAGSNMTITTNASGDTITFASSGGGGTQNVFNTFAVSGQSSVVADSTTDTLTLAAGSGINITTNASTDTITIAATASAITVQDEGSSLSTAATTLNFVGAGVTASGTGATKTITIGGGGGSQNLFSNIGVSGQGTIQADSTTDTLTFEAGTGISLATDTTNDKLTITATGGTANVANAASSIKEFKYDISSSTTTITGSDANSNTLAYEAGAIQVFLNGILLDPATDYTASNGSSVVLTDAAVSGDDVQILVFNRKIVTANVGLSTFTGDGTTTAFTLSSDPVHENNTRVHIDGVYQEKAAYSVSGTTLTFSAPPPNLSSIEVEIGFTQAEIGSTLDFADNAILRIGTGNDLQILHDGSNSIIKDTGTGDLRIAGSRVLLTNAGLTENLIHAVADGAVTLYFDNSAKLATSNTGVTITGTVTATTFSGDLSGTINTATTGTTQSASDNSTKLATTAYVTTALANLVDSAPGTLNTLNELAAALGDDANFSTTITNSLNLKVGRDSATGAASIPAGTTAQRPGSPAAGQFRYNSTLNQFEGYTSSWGAIGGGGTNTFTTDVFTSSGSAAFTLTQAVASPNDCIVHIDGIYQTPTDAYTVSGTTLTFTATPASGRKVVVYSIKAGVSGNNVEVQTINGNGTDHTFTLNVNPVNENNTIVHIDGVYQQKSSYTVSGTSLSFGSGNIPANGTVIEVATFTQTEINVPVNDTIDTVHIKDDAVTSAKLGGNLVAPGSLTVTGNFLPSADSTHDIGTSANRFANAYFDSFYGTVGTAAQTNITSLGTLTTLTVDDITINGSTISDAGEFTLDIGADIILDSDNGVWRFKDAGTSMLEIARDGSSYLNFYSAVSDMDMQFKGNDGGSTITALALDMSAAGFATFNDGITLKNGMYINNADGSATAGYLYNDSNDFIVRSFTQDKDIVFRGNDGGSVITAMTIDMSEGGKVGIGTGASTVTHNLTVYGSGTAGSLFRRSSNAGQVMQFQFGASAAGNITVQSGGLGFGGGTTENKLFIDTSGNVGVGNTSPSSYYSTFRDLVIGDGSGDHGITIATGTSGAGTLAIADGTSGNTAYRAFFQYSNNTDKLFLGSGGATRITVQGTDGNVGIGTTSPYAKLSLGAAVGAKRFLVYDGGGVNNLYAGFGIDSPAANDFSMYAHNNGVLRFGKMSTDGSTITAHMTINNLGDVSIGADGVSSGGGNRLAIDTAVNAAPVTSGTTQTGGALRLRGGDNAVLDFGLNSVNTWIQATDKVNLANGYNISLNPNGGNVGVGQSNPARTLHVKSGANNANGALRIESATSNIMDMGTDGTGHFINCVNTDPFRVLFAGTEKLRIEAGGALLPGADAAQDLGSTSKRWDNLYVNDMHFSNEGSDGNDIDGTTGNWTLQEGDEHLYIINNKSGKKFKFSLEEVQ